MIQQTETKLLTKTNTVVALSVGMIAAFIVGVNMIFFLDTMFKKIAEPISKPVVLVTNTAKMVKDIDWGTVQIDPTTKHTTDDVQFIKFFGVNNTGDIELASYNVGITNPNGFVDSNVLDDELPLVIQISAGSHPAMLLSVEIPGEEINTPEELPEIETNIKDEWNLFSSLFKINEANAIVVDPDPHGSPEMLSVCIPEKEYIQSTGLNNNEKKSKFGIKAADAIVVDPNLSLSYYYVDINGNTYYDQGLTQRANSEDCNVFTSRTMHFIDFFYGAMTPNNPAEGLGFTLAKGWEIPLMLAGYTETEGLVDLYTDTYATRAPLFIIGNAGWGGEGSFPINEFNLTLNTNEGTKELCFPETIDDKSYFVYFYDKNGKPYNDMLLTDEVACNEIPSNSCSWVTDGYCDKYPNHECCAIPAVENNVN